MKKLLFLVATATLFFASCAKDAVQTPSVLEASEDFTAIVAGGRTVLDGTSVNWCEDDQLTIFTRTSHNRQYKVKSIDSSNKGLATFEYVAFTGNDATPIAANYALYPYDATATISGDVISTTTAAEQAYNPNEVDIHHAVMVAKATDTNLEFVNAGALLRFKVKMAAGLPDEFTLQSIKLVSAANALAGAATIDLAADSKLVVAAEGSKELSLTGINTTISAAEQIFYIALPATTFAADDLTVTFTFDEGEKSVVLPAFELALNKIKTINYTINPDEFSGSTGQYGETVELQETEPTALAQELTEALADPEVGQIILPEMPAGQELEIELTTTLTFGAASRSAEAIPARNLIIDGNGATITFTGANRMVDVTKEAAGANLTLKNLTLVNGQSYMERGVNYNTNGKLVLDNVTIESIEDGAVTYAVNCPSSADNATVEIKNSKVTGGRIALNLWGENMKVNITDSELYNYDTTEVENYATIVLNNNGTDTATGSEMTITGGKISSLDEKSELWTVISNPALGTINISESTEVIGYIRDNVAIVDYGTDCHYGCLTLQEAIDKAGQDKATAKLITNITLEETVTIAAGATLTLDLNGKKLTNNVKGGRAFQITADNTTFTLNATGSEIAFGNGTYGMFEIKAGVNGAKVTINGGTYEGTTDAGAFFRFRQGNNNVVTLNNANYTDHCVLKRTSNSNAFAVSSDGVTDSTGNQLFVKGGTYNAANGFSLVFASEFDDVIITSKGCGFELKYVDHVVKNCNISLTEGGTVSTIPDGAAVIASRNGKIALTNNTITSATYGLGVMPSGGTIIATGNTITAPSGHCIFAAQPQNYTNPVVSVTIDGVALQPNR